MKRPHFKDTRVYGEKVTAAAQTKAWEQWNPEDGHRRLGFLAAPHIENHSRLGNRMLQTARKAGWAKYENGEWQKTTPPTEDTTQ